MGLELLPSKRWKLRKLWDEFRALPECAAKLTQKLESIRATRKFLDDEASLRGEFKRLFRLQWQGNSIGRFDYTDTAVLLVTRHERLEVLNALETEVSGELEKLQVANVKLAKQLGRPRHNLN